MAIEDAIGLADAVCSWRDVREGLRRFEAARRPVVERLVSVAAHSAAWHEWMGEYMHFDPVPLAYSYGLRGGQIWTQTASAGAARNLPPGMKAT